MRTTCSRSYTKTLPSPILPERAAASTASITRSTRSSETAASILTFGRKSTTYSAPRYSSVWPFCRPKPFTSVTVMPCTPMPERASRTSSSANGLMMAVTSFMCAPWGRVAGPDVRISEGFLDAQDQRAGTEALRAGAGQHEELVLARADGGGANGDVVAEVLGHRDRVVVVGVPAVDVLAADVRRHREAVAHVQSGAQVQVPAVLAVWGAEQIGERMRVLHREDVHRQSRVQLERVRVLARDVLVRVARVPVLQAAEVQRDLVVDRVLVAAVDVDLHRALGLERAEGRVLDPLDRGAPGADIPAALVGEVHAALKGGLARRLRDAAVAVVGHRADVVRQRVVRLRGLGLRERGARNGQGGQHDLLRELLRIHGVLLNEKGMAELLCRERAICRKDRWAVHDGALGTVMRSGAHRRGMSRTRLVRIEVRNAHEWGVRNPRACPWCKAAP